MRFALGASRDALTHERPYKPAWPADQAAAKIRSLAGRQFDPEVVEAFESVAPELLAPSA